MDKSINIRSAMDSAAKRLKARHIGSWRLDSEVLLAYTLKKPREWLFSHDDQHISVRSARLYRELVGRREKYEPIAYIIGQKDFFGQTFRVNPSVLIPRPETELLVEEVLDLIEASDENTPKIIDIGTGSGVIALSLAKHLPKAKIWALEAFPDAIKLAKFNAKWLNLAIKLKKSDLLESVPDAIIKDSILVANLPYLDRAIARTYPPVIRRELAYEPSQALYAAKSGTALYEKLFRQLGRIKRASGVEPRAIIIEIDSHYWRDFLKSAKAHFPSRAISVRKDYAGKRRMIVIDMAN